MRSTLSGWEVELAQWLKPLLDRLGHKARRRMCPLYVTGLIGPGDRKSVQPMAERLAPGDYDTDRSLPFFGKPSKGLGCRRSRQPACLAWMRAHLGGGHRARGTYRRP